MLTNFRCGYSDCTNSDVVRSIFTDATGIPITADVRLCPGCSRILDRLNPDLTIADHMPSDRPVVIPPTQQQLNDAAASEALAQSQTQNEAAIRTMLLNGLVTVELHLTNLAAANPTPAQQKAALIFSLKASKQLARIVLRALDSVN